MDYRLALLVTAALLSGCSVNVRDPDDGDFACRIDSDCLENYFCSRLAGREVGKCLPTDQKGSILCAGQPCDGVCVKNGAGTNGECRPGCTSAGGSCPLGTATGTCASVESANGGSVLACGGCAGETGPDLHCAAGTTCAAKLHGSFRYAQAFYCNKLGEGTCADGADGADGDGVIDCVDIDCRDAGNCTCGNGVIAAGEVCDGGNLGGKSCTSFSGYTGGELRCAIDCLTYDFSACTQAGVEDCANGTDDDGDQLKDCADPDCSTNAACTSPQCDRPCACLSTECTNATSCTDAWYSLGTPGDGLHTGPQGEHREPSILLIGDGKEPWVAFVDEGTMVGVQRYDLTTCTWTAPAGGGSFNQGNTATRPLLAIGMGGYARLAWNQNGRIFYSAHPNQWSSEGDLTTDSGYGVSGTITDPTSEPALAVDMNGHAFVAWAQQSATLFLSGQRLVNGLWTGAPPIPWNNTPASGPIQPVATFDANGMLYVAWRCEIAGPPARSSICMASVDPTGSVQDLGDVVPATIGTDVDDPALGMTPSNQPLLAYHVLDGSIRTQVLSAGSWLTLSGNTGTDWLQRSDAAQTNPVRPALSANHDHRRPAVAWIDKDQSNRQQVFVRVSDGTGWVQVAGSADATAGGVSRLPSTLAAEQASIAAVTVPGSTLMQRVCVAWQQKDLNAGTNSVSVSCINQLLPN